MDESPLKDLEKIETKDPSGYYAALGIHPSDPPEVIRKRYLHLSALFHSDKQKAKNKEDQAALNERFQLVSEAYQTLSNPRSRLVYDGNQMALLQLVPASVVDPAELGRILTALEAEMRAKKIAKLLESNGHVTVGFNFSGLWNLFAGEKKDNRDNSAAAMKATTPPSDSTPDDEVKPEEQKLSQAEDPQQKSETATSSSEGGDNLTSSSETTSNTSAENDSNPPLQETTQQQRGEDQTLTGEQPTSPPPTKSEEPANPAGPANPKSMASKKPASQVAMQLREIVVDGEKQLVILPPKDMQTQFAKMAGLGGKKTMTGKREKPPSRWQEIRQLCQKTFAPYSLKTDQKFVVPITKSWSASLGAGSKVSAASKDGAGKSSWVNAALHWTSNVVQAMWETNISLASVNVSFKHLRELSRVWTLISNVAVFKGGKFFPEYTLVFSRNLSQCYKLVNKLMLVMGEGAGGLEIGLTKFETGAGKTTKEVGSLGISLGYNALSIGASSIQECVFNKGTMFEMKGGFSQRLGLNPISGQTSITYEVNADIGTFQKLSLGVITILPFCPSPFRGPQTFFLAPAKQQITYTQLQISYTRHQHQLSIPIVVSISPKISRGVQLLVLPIFLWRVSKYILPPFIQNISQKKAHALREEIKVKLLEERSKALAVQKALEDQANECRMKEMSISGLLLTNAKYGNFESKHEGIPLTMDVTTPLQYLVTNSQLNMAGEGKSKLNGFYDPDPFLPKKLKITYCFHGRRYACELDDADPVSLPKEEHRVAE